MIRAAHLPRRDIFLGVTRMMVAYLVNQYPKTSHTFVRREIEAVERCGITVARFTLRRASDPIVTPADAEEAGRTTVILAGGALGLLYGLLRVALLHPLRLLGALRLTASISRRSERGLLVNLVYLAEACA